jgi:hypothetical protein
MVTVLNQNMALKQFNEHSSLTGIKDTSLYDFAVFFWYLMMVLNIFRAVCIEFQEC